MGQADTLMLNSYSTDAVAASGNDKPNTHAHHVSDYNHSCVTNIRIVHLKEHQPSSISQRDLS